jgi:hypothetical protein
MKILKAAAAWLLTAFVGAMFYGAMSAPDRLLRTLAFAGLFVAVFRWAIKETI